MDHASEVLLDSDKRRGDKKTIGYATENDARLEAENFRHTLGSNSKINLLSLKSIEKSSEEETIELRSKTNQLCYKVLGPRSQQSERPRSQVHKLPNNKYLKK